MLGQINIYDQILRYSLGAALIVLSTFTLQIPLWFNLVATYPIFTAMVQWDPVYALIVVIRQQLGNLGKGVAPAAHAHASS